VSGEITGMSWGLTLADKEMGSGEDDARCWADKASTLCILYLVLFTLSESQPKPILFTLAVLRMECYNTVDTLRMTAR
jgi:hypothetical protein